MSQYLVLIYETESGYTEGGEQVYKEVMVAHNEFGAKHAAAVKGGEALQPAATATSIRGGVVTDGPFAETKEQLNGFYLVTCDNLDEAVEIATHIPDAVRGSIEVRPIMEFNQS